MNNMATLTQPGFGISTDDLDRAIYKPIAESDIQVQFERVTGDTAPHWRDIDVVMTGGFGLSISSIAEKAVWSIKAKAFPFQLSYEKEGFVEAGWMLDAARGNNLFMMYSRDRAPDGNAPIPFHSIMVFKQKLLHTLESIGYDRTALAIREDLIRKSGRPGIYYTSCPDICFQFNTTAKTKPVNLLVNTELLSKIAVAQLNVRYDEDGSGGILFGRWGSRRIEDIHFA